MKNSKKYSKIALAISICLMILWGIMGTTTSVAWFTETTPTDKNIFNIGELNLRVSYRNGDGDYVELKSDSNVFDDEAVYEPGYVQVVYLKIENKGDLPFYYNTAVTVAESTPAKNVFGVSFHLEEHLKYGLIYADTEAELDNRLALRTQAKDFAEADLDLNQYGDSVLNVDKEKYAALIVRMPEEVGNAVNYRGTQPEIKLAISVYAAQHMEGA